MAKVLILGDLAPVGRAETPFCTGDSNWFTKGLEPHWSSADFRVVNLECPIVEQATPIKKVGPCLGVTSSDAAALGGFSLIGLANNHIMDHGSPGLAHTMNTLKKQGIPYIGAGQNLEQAGRPHIINIKGVSVGFIAWSHHEFCIAGEASPGAFPIDLAEGLPELEKMRQKCDFVILLYHGGLEHYCYPSPAQRKTCHFLTQKGVDVVICQHSHIIGAMERVGSSTILFGQGNYCFDLVGKEAMAHWTTGLLCELILEKGRAAEVNLVPIVHSLQKEAQPRLAEPNKSHEVLTGQNLISERLQDSAVYRKEWESYARAKADGFFYEQFPVGRFGRRILRRLPTIKTSWARSRLLRNLNQLQCEAHSEPIIDGLKFLLK